MNPRPKAEGEEGQRSLVPLSLPLTDVGGLIWRVAGEWEVKGVVTDSGGENKERGKV